MLLNIGSAAPSNDDFGAATVVSGDKVSTTGFNVGTSKEAGEPNHGGNAGGRSVWWEWTAPSNSTTSVDTFGSAFDTTLGVYTGSQVDSLTQLATSDDVSGRLQSQLSFSAVGGTTYFIAVDGFNADTGAIELNINASTVYVPYDFPTIQEAINASQDGDTVLVAPGTYDENIDFLDKSLSVLGAEGAEVTIVDGGGRNIPVARVIRTNPPAAVLHGFTIQNGTDTGVELFGFAVLEDSIVQDNSGCPAGVGVLGGSLPIIQRNVIQRNSCAGGAGGGIRAGGTTELQIIDNLITENTARDGGGIHFNAAGVVTIRGNTISHNVASQEGGGLSFANNTNPSIVQNLIVGNSASSGSAIDWLVPSAVVGNPSLVNNTIADNVISSSSTPKLRS